MAFKDEFKKFLFRGNVVDLALAVIVGGAFGKIVTALVDDIVMPVLSPIMPGGDWMNYTVTPLHIKIGHFAGTVIDFFIIALALFIVMVKVVGALVHKPEPVVAPATKGCPECLETVPAAAKRCKFCTSTLAALLLILFIPTSARADDPAVPAFEYAKPEAVKAVEWKAQVKGGLLVTGGNSQVTNGSISGAASRKAGDNKFALEAGAAYGRSNDRVFNPAGGGDATLIDSTADVTRKSVTATNNWGTKARYDRFLTENNAVYAQGALGADKIAGKKLFGGGQVGYSRQLFKNEQHLLVAELGYDFSYEAYDAAGTDAVSIHSARVFGGETWKLTDATGFYANVEALFNLNKESKALDAKAEPLAVDGVSTFKDTRVNAKAGMTTTLWKNLSFGFGVTLKYDQNPAPLSPPSGTTLGPNAALFANTLDTIVEASLIVTLL